MNKPFNSSSQRFDVTSSLSVFAFGSVIVGYFAFIFETHKSIATPKTVIVSPKDCFATPKAVFEAPKNDFVSPKNDIASSKHDFVSLFDTIVSLRDHFATLETSIATVVMSIAPLFGLFSQNKNGPLLKNKRTDYIKRFIFNTSCHFQ